LPRAVAKSSRYERSRLREARFGGRRKVALLERSHRDIPLFHDRWFADVVSCAIALSRTLSAHEIQKAAAGSFRGGFFASGRGIRGAEVLCIITLPRLHW
jgi:hypothetical protein